MPNILQSLFSLYSPVRNANLLVSILRGHDYKAWPSIHQYWTTQDFSKVPISSASKKTPLRNVLLGGMLLQIVAAMAVFGFQAKHHHYLVGSLFGAALLLAYPIVWAHLAAAIAAGRTWPKEIGRNLVCFFLERQVVQLRNKHDFKVIAVVGSIGKTSTKLAIAHTLAATTRVQYEAGNYNARVTVPLIFFGHRLPNLFNVVAWWRIWRQNRRTIKHVYPYDYVVVELGVDGPNQMKDFTYLHPDVTVVTAITLEHMEYFKTLDAVAAEELTAATFSKQTLVNSADTPAQYLHGRDVITYGAPKATYAATDIQPAGGLLTTKAVFKLAKEKPLAITSAITGEQGIKITLAAASVAHLLGLSTSAILEGLEGIHPAAGRMQILPGIKKSTLIDDTYNASPAAVIAGLDVLYAAPANQRIAILGSMNELGEYSPAAHSEVGAYCDPKKLDMVVTIGAEAEQYLAPVAIAAGCNVQSFASPYDAGEYVKSQLMSDAVILGEGSQNGVFAEEAMKLLLLHKSDASKLVRQSKHWETIKAGQFGA